MSKGYQPPKVKVTEGPIWNTIHNEARTNFDEDNDCSVIAAAILCEVSYAEAHEAFRAAGRINGRPTNESVSLNAYPILGYHLNMMSASRMYEFVPDKFKSATTYHPIRFPEIWAKFKDQEILFHSKTHAIAWKKGLMNCHARNRHFRIHRGFNLEKIQ